MHGHAARLIEGALFKADRVRQLEADRRGRRGIFRKTAVAAGAVDRQILAVVGVAGAALVAAAAVDMGLKGHMIAHRDPLHLCADLGHDAGTFMSQHKGELNIVLVGKGLRAVVPLPVVDIRAADGSCLYFDQDFICLGRRSGDFNTFHAGLSPGFDDRFHFTLVRLSSENSIINM